jgi:hypothetical protein
MMSDDEVGYGKPPVHSQFKPNNNANPNGRPKRKPTAVADVINEVLDGQTEYRERGRTKKAKRRDLTIRAHIRLALTGNIKSIETILMLRTQAQTASDTGVQRIEVTDWLPDYPGQTGEQKTREFAAQDNEDVPAWWKDDELKPKDGEK